MGSLAIYYFWSSVADAQILARAAQLRNEFKNGNLLYDWLGANLSGNATNCIGFAAALQRGN